MGKTAERTVIFNKGNSIVNVFHLLANGYYLLEAENISEDREVEVNSEHPRSQHYNLKLKE